MSDTATPRSAVALESLLNQRDRFAKLGEKDFAAATMLLASIPERCRRSGAIQTT